MRWFKVQFQGFDALLPRRAHKTSGGVDRPRCANADEQVRVVQRAVNLVHPVRHFPEPHDVRPQLPCYAACWTGGSVNQCSAPWVAFIAGNAPRIQMRAMHMQQTLCPCPFVQIVDILGDK